MFGVREFYRPVFAHSNCYKIIQISKCVTIVIINKLQYLTQLKAAG